MLETVRAFKRDCFPPKELKEHLSSWTLTKDRCFGYNRCKAARPGLWIQEWIGVASSSWEVYFCSVFLKQVQGDDRGSLIMALYLGFRLFRDFGTRIYL